MYAKELVRDIQSFPVSHLYYWSFLTWHDCGQGPHCPKSVFTGGQLYILSRDVVKWIGNFDGPLEIRGYEDVVTGI